MSTQAKKRQPSKRVQLGSLCLETAATTAFGAVITYMQKVPGVSVRESAVHLLQTRYLPFVLDKTDPNYTAFALQCAIECESWGRLIREYAGLPLPLSVTTGNPIYPVNPFTSVNTGASCAVNPFNSVNSAAHSAVMSDEQEVEQLDDDDDDEMDEEERRIIARSKAHHAALFGHL